MEGGSGTEDMLLVISLAMLLVMIWRAIWCDLLDSYWIHVQNHTEPILAFLLAL